jgi:large subunit ribosomal protein L21
MDADRCPVGIRLTNGTGSRFRMYAVFRTGGRQFRAEPGAKLQVPSLNLDAGDTVTFDDILLASSGDDVTVGTPTVDGVAVKAEVLGHGRTDKVVVFKRKRRKGYRRKQGHRQGYTEIRIDEIVL